uniref:Uncharacterized protein n=1 Tax=Anguilla anguilla TaxID=7936 RepID=A0A0E9TLY0_ANGAN
MKVTVSTVTLSRVKETFNPCEFRMRQNEKELVLLPSPRYCRIVRGPAGRERDKGLYLVSCWSPKRRLYI